MRPAGYVVPNTHESHEFDPAEIAGGIAISVSTMSALRHALGGAFLLSASLRRTAEMPADASISCAKGRLGGLKEYVVMGQLKPTATLRITR